MTTQQQDPPVKHSVLYNILLIIGLGILLCGEAYFGYRVQSLSTQQMQIREDYSTIKNITFGLFSVDEWRDKMVAIIDGQVHDFKLTSQQKRELQVQIEEQMHALINKELATFNKPQTSVVGKLKKFAVNKLVDVDSIQALVPSFARTIINKVNSPASRTRLKDIVTSKVTQLAKQTYDSTETARVAVTTYMYHKYQVNNPDDFDKQINARLVNTRAVTFTNCYEMLGCVIVALGLWWIMRNRVHLQTTLFIMSLFFALILLGVGTTASIIQVDASIKTLNFSLMGQQVAFNNQELFFQSKSILGFITVLISQQKPDAVVVGSLILLFVVVLPVVRMIARGIHVISPKHIAENRVVMYLAFEAGKWDMADVMIVGILMTYIGLNGILQSQLSNLNIHNSFLTDTTVNDTSLQPGYFIFVGYVVFTIILAYILKRITPSTVH